MERPIYPGPYILMDRPKSTIHLTMWANHIPIEPSSVMGLGYKTNLFTWDRLQLEQPTSLEQNNTKLRTQLVPVFKFTKYITGHFVSHHPTSKFHSLINDYHWHNFVRYFNSIIFFFFLLNQFDKKES